MSGEDVAFHTAYEITTDEDLDAVQRVRTALGLLDLTGAFEVLTHLNAYVLDNTDPAVTDAFWAGFRDRMAVPEPMEHLRLHLTTSWFWGHATAKAAFDTLLGDDVRRLATAGRLPELASGPLHLRPPRPGRLGLGRLGRQTRRLSGRRHRRRASSGGLPRPAR